MLWTRKTQRHRHQWFVQAHSRLQIFTVMLGSSPRLGMALAGTALEFRAGDFITSCKTSCGCALWLDCPAVNQFIYVTSQLRYVCTSCPEGRKENRKDKGRKMSAGSSRKSTEKRCFFVDLWFQKPSLMMRETISRCAVAVCSYSHVGRVFVSHRPPKGLSLHILLALIYINYLGHFYFSCALLFI